MRVLRGFRAGSIAIIFLICATNTMADLSGTYSVSSSATGSVPITGAPAPGPFTVGAAGPSFCIGGNGCSSTGLSGSVSVTATQVSFTFFGSTGVVPGSFTINLTNFSGSSIGGVSLVSGSLFSGSFGVSGFTANSMSFTGSTTKFQCCGRQHDYLCRYTTFGHAGERADVEHPGDVAAWPRHIGFGTEIRQTNRLSRPAHYRDTLRHCLKGASDCEESKRPEAYRAFLTRCATPLAGPPSPLARRARTLPPQQ